MTDLNTKQKILQASIQLFNENGLANVRLQQIAHEIGISPGNLAYHYRNKEALLQAIHEDIETEADQILTSYRIYPNLIDFDNQLTHYFKFIQKYPFYYLDLMEIDRHYPDIKSKRILRIEKMIVQIRKRLEYNESRGMLTKQPISGTYDKVAQTIWMLITFWGPKKIVDDNQKVLDVIEFKSYIWTQWQPYLTKKGRSEFEQLISPLLKF